MGDRVLRVAPPLARAEVDLLEGLAGLGPVLRIWPGQPRARSPWLPCAGGCCLVAAPGCGVQVAEAWLRLLLRDVLAPTSRAARARGANFGMPGGHRVTGGVRVDGRRVVVRGARVAVVPREAEGQATRGATTGRATHRVTQRVTGRDGGEDQTDDER